MPYPKTERYRNINKHIDRVEAMLAVDTMHKTKRFTAPEIESIKLLLKIAEAIDTLLWAMDRPASKD
jgi:hypothetical protein